MDDFDSEPGTDLHGVMKRCRGGMPVMEDTWSVPIKHRRFWLVLLELWRFYAEQPPMENSWMPDGLRLFPAFNHRMLLLLLLILLFIHLSIYLLFFSRNYHSLPPLSLPFFLFWFISRFLDFLSSPDLLIGMFFTPIICRQFPSGRPVVVQSTSNWKFQHNLT